MRAQHHEPLDRRDQGLRPIGQLPEGEAAFARLGDPLVPQRQALRLQRQRLHRLHADDGFAQRRRLPGLRIGDAHVLQPERMQKSQDDQRDDDGAGEHDPGQRRVEIEQEGQQHAERDEIEQGRQQLAGQEFAHPVDLADQIHGFARRMALEIVERQAQQAIEKMQVELGVEPRADDGNDQTPRNSRAGSRRRRRPAMITDSSVRVETLWNCSTLLTMVMTSSGGKIVRKLMVSEASAMSRNDLRSCSTRSVSQRRLNRRVHRRRAASPAQQDGLAIPDLRQAQFVDCDRRRPGRRRRVLELDGGLVGAHAGQESGGSVRKQQDDGAGVGELQQMPPTDAHRARPHARALRPLRQSRRGRRGFAGLLAEIGGIELDAMIASHLDHGLQAWMKRHRRRRRIAFVRQDFDAVLAFDDVLLRSPGGVGFDFAQRLLQEAPFALDFVRGEMGIAILDLHDQRRPRPLVQGAPRLLVVPFEGVDATREHRDIARGRTGTARRLPLRLRPRGEGGAESCRRAVQK